MWAEGLVREGTFHLVQGVKNEDDSATGGSPSGGSMCNSVAPEDAKPGLPEGRGALLATCFHSCHRTPSPDLLALCVRASGIPLPRGMARPQGLRTLVWGQQGDLHVGLGEHAVEVHSLRPRLRSEFFLNADSVAVCTDLIL